MPVPTTHECIAAAEAALGMQLPSAWQERLLRDNGGAVELADDEWQIYPVQDTSDRKRAGRTANHLALENHTVHESYGFPAEAVAIGGNASGDFLVLLPAADDPSNLADRIYRWDHETGKLDEVGSCTDHV
ncbi:MAG: SMI1/KNR4 family protein [Gemmatimonadales bacterium]